MKGVSEWSVALGDMFDVAFVGFKESDDLEFQVVEDLASLSLDVDYILLGVLEAGFMATEKANSATGVREGI